VDIISTVDSIDSIRNPRPVLPETGDRNLELQGERACPPHRLNQEEMQSGERRRLRQGRKTWQTPREYLASQSQDVIQKL
jgi:hypothetical protein